MRNIITEINIFIVYSRYDDAFTTYGFRLYLNRPENVDIHSRPCKNASKSANALNEIEKLSIRKDNSGDGEQVFGVA